MKSSVFIVCLVVGAISVLFLIYYRNIGLIREESPVVTYLDDIKVGGLGVSQELNTSSLGVKAMALSSTAGNLVKKSSGKVWPEMSTDWLAA